MGVDEQRQLAPFKIKGVFHLQLEVGQVFDTVKPLGLQLF